MSSKSSKSPSTTLQPTHLPQRRDSKMDIEIHERERVLTTWLIGYCSYCQLPRLKRNEKKYFHCIICKNTEICEKCEEIGSHDERHPLMEFSRKEYRTLPTYIRQIQGGLPENLRGPIWLSLTGADQRMQQKPQLYLSLKQKRATAENVSQIEKDLPRSYQHHPAFNNPDHQLNMSNVLQAYSIYDPSVGYVQGMAGIVGICLTYLSEEQTFWVIDRLMHDPKYNLSGLYSEGMPMAHKYLHVHDCLIKDYCPELYKHFQAENVSSMSYAFNWIVTRFAAFPTQFYLRILDIFFDQGIEIIFRLSLYLLFSNQKLLLSMEFEDITLLLQQIQTFEEMKQVDEIINGCYRLPMTMDDIQKYSNDYDGEDVVTCQIQQFRKQIVD